VWGYSCQSLQYIIKCNPRSKLISLQTSGTWNETGCAHWCLGGKHVLLFCSLFLSGRYAV